jgi:tRNA (guanine37-N1)-methyltransferase
MLSFQVLTLFPEYFADPLRCGLMGKALDNRLIEVSLTNPRDYALDRHRSVDDRPYGGGAGMVMSLEPLMRAMQSLPDPGKVIVLSPRGRLLDQAAAVRLAEEARLTIVCGRYEGIDARFLDLVDAEQVSIGDVVLGGGECAALCLMEAVSRLLPDFMGSEASLDEESFSSGLLEYPHYTRPPEYEGLKVPEVLLSGDHARIAAWRREQALRTTLETRPDLLDRVELASRDIRWLRSVNRSRQGRNLYLALLHSPVVNKQGQITSVSLTNLDIHDIARICCSYGLGGYFFVTPILDQQNLARRLLDHWQYGAGREANPDRVLAMDTVRIASDLSQCLSQIRDWTGREPCVLATSARVEGGLTPSRIRELLGDRPVLLLFGTGSGLAPQIFDQVDGTVRPLRFLDSYNHLSVRSAAAITVDRILGDML